MIDNLLSEILNKEIISVNSTLSSYKKLIDDASSIIEKLTNEDIYGLNFKDIETLLDNSIDLNLTQSEKDFLLGIGKLDNVNKMTLKMLGLSKSQKVTLITIKRKIEVLINASSVNDTIDNYSNYLEKCKKLLNQTINNNINLISDISLINSIIEKYDIKFIDKVRIFLEINKSNLDFYEKIKNHDQIEEVDIQDESNLKETNIDFEELKKVFSSLGIDLEEFNIKYITRLKKYGDIDKFVSIIKLLKENNLEYIFKNQEVFVKILLYSNLEYINNIINICKKENIMDIMKKFQTIFFPPVRDNVDINIKVGGPNKFSLSGSYNNFVNNIKFLKDLGISPSLVMEKCSTFFVRNYKQSLNILKCLDIYGITLGQTVKEIPFTVFRSAQTALKRLDEAIEFDCYPYVINHLSRISDFNCNLHRIKYARKLANMNSPLGCTNPYRYSKSSNSIYLISLFSSNKDATYGLKATDTKKMYEAVDVDTYNKKQLDIILESAESVIDIDLSIAEDPIIQELDNNFKVDNIRYSFDGVIISRLKVLRYYKIFSIDPNITIDKSTLLYIICINSMIDKEEVNKIEHSLDKIKLFGGAFK